MKPWDVISRREVFDASPYLSLCRETVRLENGEVIDDYYTIDQRDFVVISGMVNPGEVPGIRHYKHGAKKINPGLPAGSIEDGEEPLLQPGGSCWKRRGMKRARGTPLVRTSLTGTGAAGTSTRFLPQTSSGNRNRTPTIPKKSWLKRSPSKNYRFCSLTGKWRPVGQRQGLL